MKIAVVGRRGLGGVVMRGSDVARINGWHFFDLSQLPHRCHFDAVLLVKYHLGLAAQVRSACDRLIFDPLDCWESDDPRSTPQEFWSRMHNDLHFDDILATSPAGAEVLSECLPDCRVHLLPHHSDPRIVPDWYSPVGPIVYAGGENYIASQAAEIQQACDRIGRQLILDCNRRPTLSLKGAALHLHPRFPPTDSMLNRFCKPQVKAANAAAAATPILATAHPCFTSLNAGGCQIDGHDNWDSLLQRALESPSPARQPTLLEHATALRGILGC